MTEEAAAQQLEQITKTAVKKLGLYSGDGKALLLRLLIGFLVISWVVSIPAYLVVIYMLKSGFFSYDILVEGIYANGIFVLVAFFFFLGGSFALYGFVIPLVAGIAERKYSMLKAIKPFTRIVLAVLLLISGVAHYYFIPFTQSLGGLQVFLPFILLGLVTMLFVASYAFSQSKDIFLDWKRPLIFLLYSIIMPMAQPQTTADFVATGLKNFKVGGGIPATVLDKAVDGEIIAEGQLLLLGPRVAYIRDAEGKLNIIPFTGRTWIQVW